MLKKTQNGLEIENHFFLSKMTLDQAIKQVEAAIVAARNREDVGFFDSKKNIKEMLMDIEYRLNLPDKTERKA
jgi:hypothetical protein